MDHLISPSVFVDYPQNLAIAVKHNSKDAINIPNRVLEYTTLKKNTDDQICYRMQAGVFGLNDEVAVAVYQPEV